MLWHQFHTMVTTPPAELSAWLASHAAEASTPQSAVCLVLGHRVAALVDAAPSSLSTYDIRVMHLVVHRIRTLRGKPDPDGRLRWQLTALGHDPARTER